MHNGYKASGTAGNDEGGSSRSRPRATSDRSGHLGFTLNLCDCVPVTAIAGRPTTVVWVVVWRR